MSKYIYAIISILIAIIILNSQESNYFAVIMYIIFGMFLIVETYFNLKDKIVKKLELFIDKNKINMFCYFFIIVSVIAFLLWETYDLLFIIMMIAFIYCDNNKKIITNNE